METDKAIAIVGLNQEKNDGWDNGEIGKHAGDVFRQRGGGSRDGVVACR